LKGLCPYVISTDRIEYPDIFYGHDIKQSSFQTA